MNKIIAYITILLIITGCAVQQAYEGSKKNSDEVSIIKPVSGLIVRQVDKYSLDKLKSGSFETLPGKHSVIVSTLLGPNAGSRLSPPVKMVFNTEAGKKYIIDSSPSTGEYFVIEETSGEVVYKVKN